MQQLSLLPNVAPITRCAICGRALTDPVSVQVGIGPVCRGTAAGSSLEEHMARNFTDQHLNIDPKEYGFLFQRADDGTLRTNVQHLVAHHSPTGFEIGYAGSGPADLALNILETVLRVIDPGGPKTDPLWDGHRVHAAAWRFHQDFKFAFLAQPFDTATSISWGAVQQWITARLAEAEPFEDHDTPSRI